MSSTRSLKKLCESCEKDQQCLLDNGDGSQVVCEHVISEESATATSINRSDIMVIDEDDDVLSSVPLSIRSSGNTIKDRKRKFPSFREFAEAGGDELKRKVLAMEKWSSLTIREPYLVRKAMEIEAMMKKTTKQPGFYAEIENKEGELKNVWVSPMIYKELINYPLEQGETFITPLGPKESKETGYTYNNFAVQIVKDN